MGFLIAVIAVAPIVVFLMGRFSRAEGRYSQEVRIAAGRPSHMEQLGSPGGLMRAVDTDVADRKELDRLAAAGRFGVEVQTLYVERTRRLRQAVGSVAVIPVALALGAVMTRLSDGLHGDGLIQVARTALILGLFCVVALIIVSVTRYWAAGRRLLALTIGIGLIPILVVVILVRNNL